ncbi:putative small nuclear ribonucleoprotein [Encephalitozoon hellem]|uniref:Sm-like small nuclear ribonucleoprotein n=1 Tax=Encephalitozoon hellem TaxID=27973 RepID=A0A9Q9CD11_ENCHE|nr:putative small nuclear ribonucleoprotein [Encephalitozoon hellem ATCC 50504]AFM98711.1 putative small nuclear ribonucleoprotein [Encephalitozoon hellem ATCC 50504]KAG5860432.1 putative small nuclear ribonucleoprotein [Encephalitozoon hellem]UTX43684.1 Sm-like small nuclear ribonucleoprotein [Encephalitozoon hellem]WEL39160.1 putative Sm-like small nuclear ribonucleoprotein [Encephalitozoon hellem]|eukprot:XP_003887692.1 putative small nuclear ribonucleoprotein [Encephalitozoon hellem ATCC 50504]
MELPALEILKKNRSKSVRIITLNNKTYRGVLENFDMHVNTHLKDSYLQADGEEEIYIGEVLINGGTIACFDIM